MEDVGGRSTLARVPAILRPEPHRHRGARHHRRVARSLDARRQDRRPCWSRPIADHPDPRHQSDECTGVAPSGLLVEQQRRPRADGARGRVAVEVLRRSGCTVSCRATQWFTVNPLRVWATSDVEASLHGESLGYNRNPCSSSVNQTTSRSPTAACSRSDTPRSRPTSPTDTCSGSRGRRPDRTQTACGRPRPLRSGRPCVRGDVGEPGDYRLERESQAVAPGS